MIGDDNMKSNLLSLLLSVTDRHEAEICSRRLEAFLDKTDLLRLRLVSKTLRAHVSTMAVEVFKKLYVTSAHYKATRTDCFEALYRISSPCLHLCIRLTGEISHPGYVFQDDSTIGEQMLTPTHQKAQSPPRRFRAGSVSRPRSITSTYNTPEDSYFPQTESDRVSDWQRIFQALPNVSSVTISVQEDVVNKGWDRFGKVEAAITAIRVALQNSDRPLLNTLRFEPIHAAGIIHCLWQIPTASEGPSVTAATIYDKVQTLHLQIFNPLPHMSETQQAKFIRSLRDWLESFSDGLKTLSFHWVGGRGPNPLLLDLLLKPHEDRSEPLVWRQLHSVTLGNVKVTQGDLIGLAHRLPRAFELRVSEDTVRLDAVSSDLADFQNPRQWVSLSKRLVTMRVKRREMAPLSSLQIRHIPTIHEGIGASSAPRRILNMGRSPDEFGEHSFDLKATESDENEMSLSAGSLASSFGEVMGRLDLD